MPGSDGEYDDAPDVSSHKHETSTNATNDSAIYTQEHVTEDLHPAFVDSGLSYEAKCDGFVAEFDNDHDGSALFDSQRTFANALEKYQQDVKIKYKSEIDLGANHDWNEVMKYANEARDRYIGVGKEGIMKKIDNHLKTFQTAAPAIQAWLKLLPSTSTFGSVAAVRLRQLRKETLDALDKMPLCIERAQLFMRTCGYENINQQTCDLFLAILEALHHILEWFGRAAGVKYLSSLSKGPVYTEALNKKMKNVEKASEAIDERVKRWEHIRLEDIRRISVHTKDQVGDLKILALEARNHLYAILRDTEVWQETLQAWKQSDVAKDPTGRKSNRATQEREDQNKALRKSLLTRFQEDHIDQSRDEENVLTEITSMTLGDQDRAAAIIEHQAVENWLLDPRAAALLVQGNGRRHDPIAPTSVACALLIHVFSKKLHFPTLYWYCGLHSSGSRGNPISMLKNLICQLLSLSCCKCSVDDRTDLGAQDFENLMRLFVRLIRRSSVNVPVVCVLDSISFYEARHQRKETSRLVDELADLATSDPSVLLLLVTSPLRTMYVAHQSHKAQRFTVAEIPYYVSGANQGLNLGPIIASTGRKVENNLGGSAGRR